jgi:hypothetical protein
MRPSCTRASIAVLALALSGCAGSGGHSVGQPTQLEIKVANLTGTDPARVRCHKTGHSFNGEPLASCTFDDGTGGCYDANTGKDLTVPARARYNGSQLPECWQ